MFGGLMAAGGGMSGGPTATSATSTSTSNVSVQQGNISFGTSSKDRMALYAAGAVVAVVLGAVMLRKVR